MHDMIRQGKALYWGTSEWSASEIMAAWQIAERHHLAKPVVEQPEYNLFHRKRVETEYRHLFHDIGLGLSTWSPLASGLLTGKYRQGVPKDSRGAIPRMQFLVPGLTDAKKNAAVGELEFVAKEIGCTLAQLAIAWCAKNPHVSTVITGASRVEQVRENLKAIEVVPRLTGPVLERIEKIVAGHGD
jgi:aryl-alcohol dehydrogenase-like predicted oxidoreductase